MNTQSRRFRLTQLLAATSLTVSAGGGTPALAQPASDPPWRVGRLAQISGSVSTHGNGATEWSPAGLNVPLTSGDALWTQPAASAAIQISDNLVALNESTELDLATLDNQQFIATEPQGELFLDLRDVATGDSTTITTPRGVVKLSGAGEYDILAGDSATPTTISVVAGSAQIVSGSFSLTVATNQTATVTGSDALLGSVGPLAPDPFLADQLRRLAPPPAGPPAIRHMTGCESLAAYGSWQPSPEYGQVWYPHVDHGWAPYREGSWHYVAPWGWTWVDDEPWGFAPFHYGRWSQFDGRWGWVPAEPQAPPDAYEQPAYAPALVDFVVAGAVVGAGVGLLAGGFGGRGDRDRGGDVGWVPLGPRERYQPQFAASQTYLQRLNPGQDAHRATAVTALGGYANRGALTVVPAAAMARSEPVGRIARTGAALQAAGGPDHRNAPDFQPVRGAFPVQPVAATRGVTPAVAQRFGIAGGPNRPAAPGPAVNPVLFRPHELPAGRTPFRTQGAAAPAAAQEPARPQAALPGHPSPPVPAVAAPHPAAAPGPALQPNRPNGLPALRAPGGAPPGAPAAAAAPHVEGGQHPAAVAAHQEAAPNRAGPAAPLAARPAAPAAPTPQHQVAAHPAPARPPAPAAHEAPQAPRAEPPRPAVHEAARPPQPQPHAAPREAPRPPAARPAPPPRPAAPPPRPAPPHPAPAHPAPPGHKDDHPRR